MTSSEGLGTSSEDVGARTRIRTPSEWSSFVTRQLPSSRWVEISQSRIVQFAECIEDEQWIHVDPERARHGPFRQTVAHGFLTLSMLTMLLEDAVDVSQIPFTVNYGLDRVRFPAPVPSGSRIRGSFTVASVKEVAGGVQVTLDATVVCETQSKPVCVATMLLRFYDSLPSSS